MKVIERLESRVLLHSGPADGTGLAAQYFDNRDFTGLKLSRTDAQVNFNWGSGSPASSIGSDTFSVRWTGTLVPHLSESYTFHTSTDDGVRLWIDGKLVIDRLSNQPLTTYSSAPIALTAGKPVAIRVDYFDNTGQAQAKLIWSSKSTPREIVPKSHLYPTSPPPSEPPPSGNAIRIDAAGSSSYTDSSGFVWQSDRHFSGGGSSLGAFAIAGTTDDSLYYTRRFGKNFSYAIPVPAAGQYRLTLHFADASYNAGGRKFNVSAEGNTILSNFDIVATGGKGVAVKKTFDLAVDSTLNLTFASVVNNATLSAIEVAPLSTTPATKITWKTVAPSPVVRAEASGAVVNGKLYLIGGYYSTDTAIIAQKRCDVYDPATNSWKRLSDMPIAFTHCGVAVDGATIWLVGQYTGNHPGPGSAQVWKYNTATNAWSRGPDLPAARGAGAAAIVGRNLHYFGGMDATRTNEQGEHWVLNLDNPAGGWQAKASLPNPRNHLGGAALGGKIYAIGGQHGQEEVQDAQSDVHRYDPATNAWTKVASLPGARSHLSGSVFTMNGKLIVIGGETKFLTQTSTIYSYDPATNKWSLLGNLPAPRSTAITGFVAPNKIIVSTGNNPDAKKETWIGTLS